MNLRLEDIYLEIKTKEELKKVSLIFRSYGFYWRDKDNIVPIDYESNEIIYTTLSEVNLSEHHYKIGYRLSYDDNDSFAKRKNKSLITVEDFIKNY